MTLKEDPEGDWIPECMEPYRNHVPKYTFPIMVEVDSAELTPENRAIIERRAEFYRRRAENAANEPKRKTVEVDLEMLKEMISALYDVEALLLRAPPGDPDQECELHPEFQRLLKAFKPFTGRQ